MRLTWVVLGLGAAALAAACSESGTCIAGVAEPCACAGDGGGKKICLANGQGYSACLGCPPYIEAALGLRDSSPWPPDAWLPFDGPRADGGQADARIESGQTLFTSKSPIMALFPIASGIIVVTRAEIVLVDRQAKTLKTVTAPREIQTAAMAGSTLAVADTAMVVVYDSQLRQLRQFSVKQMCFSSVIVSGDRYVCGPANDGQRVFDTYDLAKGTLLTSSFAGTYHGLPLRRVPGQDYFVTVSSGSPSDFQLYQVQASGAVSYVGESQYHGAFPATTTYAFDAQAVHLVNESGLLLKIIGTSCSNSFTSDCFLQDGVLGTIGTNDRFAALADDGQGLVFGIVRAASSLGCFMGCEVQMADAKQHVVLSKKTHYLEMSKALESAYDAQGKRLLVAYRLGAGNYRLASLDF